MAFTRPELERFAAKERDRFEDMLKDFVEVPSISAEPGRKGDVEQVRRARRRHHPGLRGRAELHRVPGGNPIVLGSFESGKGRPTVTVYNHLDVQPASKETEPWRTEPFELTKQGDTYLGRGTTDDKGPALTALFGARAAIDAGVPVNIKFLWETEEEIGLAPLRGDAPGHRPRRRDRRGGRLGHRLGVAGPAVALRGPARPAAPHLPPRDRRDRPALGHHRRRRPQPRGRARPARRRDLRRPHRPREDPRLLRRRRASHEEAGRRLQGRRASASRASWRTTASSRSGRRTRSR